MSTLREKILAIDDRPLEVVDVPEWGCKVGIRTPSIIERNRLVQSYTDGDGRVQIETMFQWLVIGTACDPDTGELLFTEDDLDELAQRSATVMDRLADVAMRAAGIIDLSTAVDAGKLDSSATPSSGIDSDSQNG